MRGQATSETRSRADKQARVSLKRKSVRTRKTEPERNLEGADEQAGRQGSWLSREEECDRSRKRSQSTMGEGGEREGRISGGGILEERVVR